MPFPGRFSAHSIMRTSLAESCTLSNLIMPFFRCVCALFMHRRSHRYVGGTRDLPCNRLRMMDFQLCFEIRAFQGCWRIGFANLLAFGWVMCALVEENSTCFVFFLVANLIQVVYKLNMWIWNESVVSFSENIEKWFFSIKIV